MKKFKQKLKELQMRFRQWKFKNWLEERKIQKLRRQEEKYLRRDAVERAYIADVFNERYCIAVPFIRDEEGEVPGDRGQFNLPVKKGNRWMCPDCNTLHAPVKHLTFTGLIYPKCCRYHEGSRHDSMSARATLKRPLGMYGTSGLWFKLRRAGLEPKPTIGSS